MISDGDDELTFDQFVRQIVNHFAEIYYNPVAEGVRPVWFDTYWLGTPTQKLPLDLWIYQEILYKLKPDVIIECGTAAGGSALYMATICDAIGKGRILTIDVIDECKVDHPRITRLIGSSTAPETIQKMKNSINLENEKVMVILDSDHHKDHVLNELTIYAEMVSPGSYLIVEDTNINGHPVWPEFGPGPMEAVEEFMKERHDFYQDRTWEKFYITQNPKGFLFKGVKPDDKGDNRTYLGEPNISLGASYQWLQSQLAAIEKLNEDIRSKDALINQIMSGVVMRFMTRIKLTMDIIAPPGTRLNHIFQLMLKGIHVLQNEGIGGFSKKFIRWLINNEQCTFCAEHRNTYARWITKNEPSAKELERQRDDIKSFTCRPKISIITPVWNPEARWLDKAIQSVLDQTYDNWELCLADGGSTADGVKEVLLTYAAKDSRIKTKLLKENMGISVNTNEALSLASGEYVGFLDHDDELSPFALYEVVKLLNENPDTDFIYSDEDKIDITGKRFAPFLKPDWSPDLLISVMYTCHLTIYKKLLVEECGGFRSEYDFSQDYDMALRISEKSKKISHVAKILYHWRSVPGSAAAGGKRQARLSNIKALSSAVIRRKYTGTAEIVLGTHMNRVKYNLATQPLVSIIISADSEGTVVHCIDNILGKTTYPHFKIIIVTNTGLAVHLTDYYRQLPQIHVVVFDEPSNLSAQRNFGFAHSSGDYALFLNSNQRVVTENWLEEMVGLFNRKEIGAVGPKLLYADGTIQQAGLVTGARGLIGSAFHRQPANSNLNFYFIQSTRNVSALSAACLMIPRDVFQAVNGFDSINTPARYSDVDLCFRIREAGYLLVYMPFATLKLAGHVSVNETSHATDDNKADLYLLERWQNFVSYDPYYPPKMRDLLSGKVQFN